MSQGSTPSYRLHKSSGQAVVTLTGSGGRRKDVLLGTYGTAESHAKYQQVVAEWQANGRTLPEADDDHKAKGMPKYARHKASGQARVTLTDAYGQRRDVLLGRHGTAESRREYARVIAEWEAAGRLLPANGTSPTPDITVNELLAKFWDHAERHYRHPDGTPTSELTSYKLTLRPLRLLYGDLPAAEFSPLKLKAVRQAMVDDDLSLGVVNLRVARIKHVFRWAVAEELVPSEVHHALATVSAIPRGRGLVRETQPVGPVPDEFVDAVKPYVMPEIWAMIELQRLTGCRPGEVVQLRPCDLDTSGPVWLYRPHQHKGGWRGKERVIAIGPRGQAVLKPHLPLDTQAAAFSPRRALAARAMRLRADRVTKVQPSQQHRRSRRPQRTPGDVYTVAAYAVAIRRACVKADVPHWHPNQLRHLHATKVRKHYGIEAAGATLGHSKMSVTEVYAERDRTLAARIASEVG